MLDRYLWGDAERISPEAPVMVLREDLDEVRPGGAANVASFLRGLNCEAILAGVIGDDADGRTLLRLMNDLSVDVEGVEVGLAVPDLMSRGPAFLSIADSSSGAMALWTVYMT
jgi:bifunctional ADP-heptose synthase (sugar kinase/adenylyltransferase)